MSGVDVEVVQLRAAVRDLTLQLDVAQMGGMGAAPQQETPREELRHAKHEAEAQARLHAEKVDLASQLWEREKALLEAKHWDASEIWGREKSKLEAELQKAKKALAGSKSHLLAQTKAVEAATEKARQLQCDKELLADALDSAMKGKDPQQDVAELRQQLRAHEETKVRGARTSTLIMMHWES